MVIPVPNQTVVAVVHYPAAALNKVSVSDAVIRRCAVSGVTSGDRNISLS